MRLFRNGDDVNCLNVIFIAFIFFPFLFCPLREYIHKLYTGCSHTLYNFNLFICRMVFLIKTKSIIISKIQKKLETFAKREVYCDNEIHFFCLQVVQKHL